MRFTTFFLVALLLFATGTAVAGEKTPDVMNTAASTITATSSNPPFFGVISDQLGTYDRIYNQGAVDAQCGAEVLDSANDGMYYDILCLQVDDTNPIELVVAADGTDIIDTVLTLYCSPFDPLFPDRNVIAFDDDSGLNTLSAFTLSDDIRLAPGSEYWLVISTFGANMTGNYVIQPSGNVYDCGAVANEAASWGAVKGLYR